ncbi:MAG: hypothetical protein CL944_02210 [Candidatus Diapherotrites archaeon]|uniref:Uncharacterized protein n=1 Tax=Candidatus Iainarchaeum sp. TaxID=3101447 RepID=A0A2D6LPZ7_9ARCH|nr:hypothetical protein [Candidatus Diapherotrites archaeon]|tara:strand:+ start:15417 stop:15650 length:234 start_codon:yes stop_codon:yes gene_type:complete
MEKQVKSMFTQAIFFFIIGVVLASLFMWSMMQGITIHFTGNDSLAFSYYFVGWISGIAAFSLYWQAKNLFHFAKISR